MIKRIVIEVEGKELSLTPEQARELHAELGQMLGKPDVKEVIVREPYTYPYPHWQWIPNNPPITWLGNGTGDAIPADCITVACASNEVGQCH